MQIIYIIILLICGIYLIIEGDKKSTPYLFVIGGIFTAASIIGTCIYVDKTYIKDKPKYEIQLLNQTDVIIKTETQLDTIKFDSINNYILKDNL